MTKPKIIIFAGANGSGKTTAAKELLPEIGLKEFVNADEIARGLSPFNSVGQAMTSGRLVLKRIDELISKGESFALETTLSGSYLCNKLQKAKDLGYVIEMHYIFCSDVEMNIERINERVKQGGHGVPEVDVRRRYNRSLLNLVGRYVNYYDKLVVYDTSYDIRQVLQWHNGRETIVINEVLFNKFLDKIAEVDNGS